MLTQINLISGFVEEVNRLSEFPEITGSDTAYIILGNYDHINLKPLHNEKYDERLFGAFSNSVRKLVILKNEPIQIKNIHKKVAPSLDALTRKTLDSVYSKLQNYLGQKINNVTQMSFTLDVSTPLDSITVREAINIYFAATEQHAKPELQRKVTELNLLCYGNLTEMIRISLIEIVALLNDYKDVVTRNYKPH